MSNMLTAAAADLESAHAEYAEAEAAFNEACNRRARAMQRLTTSQTEVARHLASFESRAPQGTPWSQARALTTNRATGNYQGGDKS